MNWKRKYSYYVNPCQNNNNRAITKVTDAHNRIMLDKCTVIELVCMSIIWFDRLLGIGTIKIDLNRVASYNSKLLELQKLHKYKQPTLIQRLLEKYNKLKR